MTEQFRRVCCHVLSLMAPFICIVMIVPSTLCAAEKVVPRWMSRNFLSFGWSSAAPFWHTFDKTEGFSPIGATLGIQLRLNPRVSIGPVIHWQLLDSVSSSDTQGSSQSGHLHVWRERRFFSSSVTLRYYLLNRQTMLPYIGLGIGGMRVREKYGLLSHADNAPSWHLLTAPELGMYLLHGRIPVWMSTRLAIGIPRKDSDGEMLLLLILGVTVPN